MWSVGAGENVLFRPELNVMTLMQALSNEEKYLTEKRALFIVYEMESLGAVQDSIVKNEELKN